MAETQIYTHRDIQRYLRHEMSEPEMHQFEIALMNDPFLADALEGFSAADEAVTTQHLEVIERSLTGDQPGAKVVALTVQKTRWWKVAAVVITIVTAGGLTYSVIDNRNRAVDEIRMAAAPRPATSPENSAPNPGRPLADVTALPNKRSAYIQRRPGRVATAERAGKYGREAQAIGAAPKANDTLTNTYPQPTASAIADLDLATEKSTQEMRAADSERSKQSNRMLASQSAKTVTPAGVMAKRSLMTTTADTGGRPGISAADSGAALTANASGYRPEESSINRRKEEKTSSLQEDSLSLAEVVVSTLSKRKKAVATIHADSSVAAEPATGWNSFQQYFNQQLDSLKAADPMVFDEDIVLEFLIDAHGRPTNIKLPGIIDNVLREKTVMTLSNGPVWRVREKGKKVKIIIGF